MHVNEFPLLLETAKAKVHCWVHVSIFYTCNIVMQFSRLRYYKYRAAIKQ
jgi:hypothetical protein